MCGIAGYWGADAGARTAWMTCQLAHRGPDDEGVWETPGHTFALGNRRLKILDLSPLGHQPMASNDGLRVLTFNGEIYNFIELRDELASRGHRFRSQSDTEVLLAALEEWDVSALNRVSGMFAFAFWDGRAGRLMLARDRLGIKPLYYAQTRDGFCFASEISAILASGLVSPILDTAALESYLRLLWIPEPGTLFSGISKLEAGQVLLWDGTRAAVQRYWDLPIPDPQPETGRERVAEEVSATLQSAVMRQLRSDVPVGAFLSGGLDSTSILQLAAMGSKEVRSYSIGFASADRTEEGALDDLRYARLAAEAFGVRHQEIVLSPHIVDLLPKMVRHLEDPVADPAAINCYLICEAARETSTVLLSGTGGDELFGGYRKYAAESLAARYQRVPPMLRGALLEPTFRTLPIAIGRKGLRSIRLAKKFIRYAGATPLDRFLGYTTYYDASELEELLGGDPGAVEDPYMGVHALQDAWDRRDTGQIIDRMSYVDLKQYLPCLGLAYMDRASMAASVEVRVPLLDDDVVDLVSRLPDSYKVRGLSTKLILREAMKGKIPEVILRRPKAPFAAPIRSWLRRDLAPVVEEYLSPGRVLSRGLLNPGVVHRMRREHRLGLEDHSLRIWALLTLEVWLQEFYDKRARFEMPAEMREVVLASSRSDN